MTSVRSPISPIDQPRDHTMAFALFLIVSALVILCLIKLMSDDLSNKIHTANKRFELRSAEHLGLIRELREDIATLTEQNR